MVCKATIVSPLNLVGFSLPKIPCRRFLYTSIAEDSYYPLFICMHIIIIIDESDFISVSNQYIGTISTAQRKACYSITILDDRSVESNETFTVMLHGSNFPTGAHLDANRRAAIVKITDSDGKFHGCKY